MDINSKSAEAVKIAFKKGYRVTENGTVINAVGKVRKLVQTNPNNHNNSYYRFNVCIDSNGSVFPVLVHQLQAYQKYGDAIFGDNIHVRHLNGNSLDNSVDNIVIGTASENEMDKSPETRKRVSALGVAKIARKDWHEIEKDYFENGLGFKKLAKKYNMSTGTLSYHFKKLPNFKPAEVKDQYDWDEIIKYYENTGCTYVELSKKFGCSTQACTRRITNRKNK